MHVGRGQGAPHSRQMAAPPWISRARAANAAKSVRPFSANGQWKRPVGLQVIPSSGWLTTTHRSPGWQAAWVSNSSCAVCCAVWQRFASAAEQPDAGLGALDGFGAGANASSVQAVPPHSKTRAHEHVQRATGREQRPTSATRMPSSYSQRW